MLEAFLNRVAENKGILPLVYEKLNIGFLVRAIKLVLSDYERYTFVNSVRIIDQVLDNHNQAGSLIYLERLVAKSVEFQAKNGEVGSLEIEINHFNVDHSAPKVEIRLDVFFRINNIVRRSKIQIVINLDSSNISLYISSFLLNEFSTLGVGSDVMKILIEISKQTRLDMAVVPSLVAEEFYIKNGFCSVDNRELRRDYWKNIDKK
jgi:hypothetical protein